MVVFAIGAVVTVVVASVAVALFLRSYVLQEVRTEARLHDPKTHTIAYAIPAGVDPVVFKVGLTHAGFTSGTDRVGDAECLIVECAPAERDTVRGVIEAAHATAYDGSELKLEHIVFEDER
jgi:hypothetical protein